MRMLSRAYVHVSRWACRDQATVPTISAAPLQTSHPARSHLVSRAPSTGSRPVREFFAMYSFKSPTRSACRLQGPRCVPVSLFSGSGAELDDTDLSVLFQACDLHFRHLLYALQPQTAMQVINRHHLLSQVRAKYSTVAYQSQRTRNHETRYGPGLRRQPVEQPIPAEDRGYENQPLGHGLVATSHGVLRAIRNQYQQQNVGNADRADIATQDEAEDQEQEPVHGAG